MIRIDDYVLDVLMRDLVGHDRSPSAYLVYLHLWSQTIGRRAKSARLSHQMVASATGLSKSAAQAAMRRLLRRRLVSLHRGRRSARSTVSWLPALASSSALISRCGAVTLPMAHFHLRA